MLAVGRLETVKRPQLAIEAMTMVDRPVELWLAGDGTQRANLEALAAARGVGDRVRFLGAISDDELLALYAGALAVAYVPFDEDFGYVTLEAFLARKPVITASDSGGTAGVRRRRRQRRDRGAEAGAAGRGDQSVRGQRAKAASHGDAGHAQGGRRDAGTA